MEKSRIWHNGVPGIISSWTSARPKRSDYRRARKTEHTPLCINGKVVERVDSIKFLGVHISFDHSRTADKSQLVKKAQQWFFFFRKLKQTRLSSQLVTNFYRATAKRVLCLSVTVWYGSCRGLWAAVYQIWTQFTQYNPPPSTGTCTKMHCMCFI